MVMYHMPLKICCVTALEVSATGARMGLAADSADLMRMVMAELAELISADSILISPGIKYQYAEIALINMELV